MTVDFIDHFASLTANFYFFFFFFFFFLEFYFYASHFPLKRQPNIVRSDSTTTISSTIQQGAASLQHHKKMDQIKKHWIASEKRISVAPKSSLNLELALSHTKVWRILLRNKLQIGTSDVSSMEENGRCVEVFLMKNVQVHYYPDKTMFNKFSKSLSTVESRRLICSCVGYHLQLLCHLDQEDCAARQAMCQDLLMTVANENLMNIIFFQCICYISLINGNTAITPNKCSKIHAYTDETY
ncbi:hypothetical protein C0J52_21059 [Blattella germanica]|nr:hypothetical protein C0J52_21059 [Blattella germanica]